ncbi:MAG: radical SAM protein, partial [Candidatus Omnitrophica bacterium]|nr:radical SAM protein [Candidatus Omnitrophota bacterium]
MERIVFGPVPSRRFGQSLGINNIFSPKRCSYSCIYCQIGRTLIYEIERKEFYKVEDIKKQVKEVIENLKGKKIDYISFVPDGEPTLDINLGKEIEILKEFGIKIAVITNSSLIWRKDVRDDLKKADCVSLKIDAVSVAIWKKINRPNKKINLESILEGIQIFSEEFKGQLLTETLFIKDINDSKEEIEKIGEFIKKIEPEIAYIGYPTRPPAEKWVKIPEKEKIDFAYIVFKSKNLNVKIIEKKEEREFGFTGDLVE